MKLSSLFLHSNHSNSATPYCGWFLKFCFLETRRTSECWGCLSLTCDKVKCVAGSVRTIAINDSWCHVVLGIFQKKLSIYRKFLNIDFLLMYKLMNSLIEAGVAWTKLLQATWPIHWLKTESCTHIHTHTQTYL